MLVALAVLPLSVQAVEPIRLLAPMASYNQVYRDATGYWGLCSLGTAGCPDRVASTGCLVTCFAMVLSYYRIELTVTAASSCTGQGRTGMDPGILNDWLRAHGGYGRCAQDPAGNCCLDWDRLPPAISLAFYENTSATGLDRASRTRIDRALARGHPVVAGVHWGKTCHGGRGTEDCHWVVLTGKSADSYWINDPYARDTSSREGVRTTLSKGTLGAYTIDRYVLVTGPVPRPTLAEPTLAAAFDPGGDAVRPGGPQQRTIEVREETRPVLLFARAIDPRGAILYAHYLTSAPDPSVPLLLSPDRESVYPEPRRFDGTVEWSEIWITEADLGNWIWEIWIEDPAAPGDPLAYDVAGYTVVAPPATALPPPSPTLAVGLAIAITLAVTALVYLGAARD